MNTENCSFGWATDNVFQSTPTLDCSSSIIAYYVVCMALFFLRFLSFLRRYYNWKRQTSSKERSKAKYSISSLISFATTFLFLLLILLPGLNIANVENGISFALFSLAFIPFVFDLSLSLFRLVRLGKKIIPLMIEDVDQLNHLQQFEKVGTLLFSLQTFSALASSVLLVILGPTLPEYDHVFARIGFAFK